MGGLNGKGPSGDPFVLLEIIGLRETVSLNKKGQPQGVAPTERFLTFLEYE